MRSLESAICTIQGKEGGHEPGTRKSNCDCERLCWYKCERVDVRTAPCALMHFPSPHT